MPWLPTFNVDHNHMIISISFNASKSESQIIAEQLIHTRQQGSFEVLRGWRNELYPILGVQGRMVEVERAGSALLGIDSRGVHCTAYAWIPATTSSSVSNAGLWLKDGSELRIWVPRRAATKSTYPNMLDNTVAGGISSTETPRESLLREALEEASLPYEVTARAKAVGVVSYVHIRDARAGGETGLVQPEGQFCYDLELSNGIPSSGPWQANASRLAEGAEIPQPNDDEVSSFELMSVPEVWEAMARAEFKPNCALVLLDFFIRWGFLRPGAAAKGNVRKDGESWIMDTEDYCEVVSRLHRRYLLEDAASRIGHLGKGKKA